MDQSFWIFVFVPFANPAFLFCVRLCLFSVYQAVVGSFFRGLAGIFDPQS